MKIEDLTNRFEDAVTALERIADVLEALEIWVRNETAKERINDDAV